MGLGNDSGYQVGDKVNKHMFIDASRYKLIVLSTIISAIALGIAAFMYADKAYGVLSQTGYELAMQASLVRYQLLYRSSDYAVHAAAAGATEGGTAHSIPVLLYHGEAGGPDMPTGTFIDQMRALKSAGWQTITMLQFDQWEKGKISLPDKSFLLTFDDGRTDTFYPVDPVLKDLHYSAVMFVIAGLSLPDSGKSLGFYLDKTALKNMVASGRWDIESHGLADHAVYAVQTTTDLSQSASTTQGHFLSDKFWNGDANNFETDAEFKSRVTQDLTNAKQTIEQDLGTPVIAFAYPFNDFGEDSVNFRGAQAILDKVVPNVYTYAFYQTWAGNGDSFNYAQENNGPGSSPYMIKRIEPENSWTGADLLAVLDNGRAKSLPYAANRLGNDWSGTWGDVLHVGGTLQLSAAPQTTGASAFLDGSGWWQEYRFDATVKWNTGESVSLLARADAQDYLACAFSDNRVSLERHHDTQLDTIATASRPFTGAYDASQFSMRVVGQNVTCYENGVPVISGASATARASGGIGVEIWDATKGKAEATFESVAVQGLSLGANAQAARYDGET